MTYRTTTTQIVVHREGDNPIYGESATRIRLEDETGGLFVVLEQDAGSVKLDPEELNIVIEAAKQLLADAPGCAEL